MSKQMVITRDDRLNFILAGYAEFILRSLKTGTEINYIVRTPVKHPNATRRNVWVLVKNTRRGKTEVEWVYIGIIDTTHKMLPFRRTKMAGLTSNHMAVWGFAWFWYKLVRDEEHSRCDVIHVGRCGRCKRKLIDPLSVKRGLGPICHSIIRRKKYGIIR